MNTQKIFIFIPLLLFLQAILISPRVSFDRTDRLTDPLVAKSTVLFSGENFSRPVSKTFKSDHCDFFVHTCVSGLLVNDKLVLDRQVFSSHFNPALLIHSLTARAPPV